MPTSAIRAAEPAPARWRVRWTIFGLVFAFALIRYFQGKGLTIAAARMMPELHLSQLQIGWLEQALVIGYTCFQLPGGVFGQRVGARVAFSVFGLTALAAVIGTTAAPELLHGGALFIMLLITQFILGCANAGQGPVGTGVNGTWFPSRQWPLITGLSNMGLGFGAALTGPLIASITVWVGWQRALLFTGCPALLVLVAIWYWYARDTPREHPGVSGAELAELDEAALSPPDKGIGIRRVASLLANRNVLLLTLSYVLMNYSFYLLSNWCFLYLIQERHLSILHGGWLAAIPPLAAALGSGLGGMPVSRLCMRFGVTWGYRIVPLLALPAAGLLLMAAVMARSPGGAVAALTGCFACVELTEASFWGATMNIGRSETMAVGGVVNTGGNLGGIIGIPIVAFFSGHGAWITAFAIGAAAAIGSAVLWLGIDAGKPVRRA